MVFLQSFHFSAASSQYSTLYFRTLLFIKDNPDSGTESPGSKTERTSFISNYTNTGKFANSLIRLFRDPKLHFHFSLRITSLYTSEWETSPGFLVIMGKCHRCRAGVDEIFARLWASLLAYKPATAAVFLGFVCRALRFAADKLGTVPDGTFGGAYLL